MQRNSAGPRVSGSPLTVIDCLHAAFPKTKVTLADGTIEETLRHPRFPSQLTTEDALDMKAAPPLMPFDTFGMMAHLIELSGCYHHIVPEIPTRPQRTFRQLVVTRRMLDECQKTSRAWAGLEPRRLSRNNLKGYRSYISGSAIKNLFQWWHDVFVNHGDQAVFIHLQSTDPCPGWWLPALKLLISADNAAAWSGFELTQTAEASWINKLLSDWFGASVKSAYASARTPPDDNSGKSNVQISGFSTMSAMCPDIGAVLPKARTPSVGCTLRSLSHNLALLPPQGVARASWLPYAFQNSPPDEAHLNLLLIPFPYSVASADFKPSMQHTDTEIPWGFFSVQQNWLQPFHASTTRLVAFVESLIREAEKHVDAIHGIIFPEVNIPRQSRGL